MDFIDCTCLPFSLVDILVVAHLIETLADENMLDGIALNDWTQAVPWCAGINQMGDNQYVDQTEWKAGTINEIHSTVDESAVIVAIIEKRNPEPKTLKEAKGLVTSDYQVELEAKWLEALRAKYPVSVDEKVLDKVRKLYQ